MEKEPAYFYLEKVFWRSVDLVKALLAVIRHSLHDGPVQVGSLGRGGGMGRRVGLVAGALTGALIARHVGDGRVVVCSRELEFGAVAAGDNAEAREFALRGSELVYVLLRSGIVVDVYPVQYARSF